MKPKTKALLKALLSTDVNQKKLLQFLPAEIAEEVQNLSLAGTFSPSAFFSSSAWSQPIHFSWFFPIIKDFPEQVQYLFSKALTPTQAEGVQKMLFKSAQPQATIPFLRPFLLEILRKNLVEPEILSEQLLPPSPMNALLGLERKYLFQVADLLGLNDLAADLRQVVDKETIRQIHNVLSQEQLHFLNYCTKQPIKWVPPKLGLSSWDGSVQQLKSLLHYRGLIRMAKAIFQEDTSYKWHLLHRMDTGRAKIIQKEFYQKQDPTLAPFFKNQVLHIAKRYQA